MYECCRIAYIGRLYGEGVYMARCVKPPWLIKLYMQLQLSAFPCYHGNKIVN